MILQRIQDKVNFFFSGLRINKSYRQNTIIISLALIFCIVSVISGLLFSYSFTPIFVALGISCLFLLFVGLERPWYVLCVAIFVIFIPTDLLSSDVQSYLNRGMTVLTFAFWVFDLFMKKKKIYLPLPSIIMIAFLVWAILSITWAQDLSEALTIIQRYILRFLLFLLLTVNMIDTRKKLDALLNTLAIIGISLILIGIAVIFIEGYTPGTRFKILGMNENGVGILLLICLLGVMWWVNKPSKQYDVVKKLIGVFYIVSSIMLIAMSGSRGSAISMIVAILLFLLFKPTRFWGILAVTLAVIGFLAFPSLFLTTIERFSSNVGYSGDTTLGGREELWQLAWLLIRDHPFLGVGIGNGYLQMKNYLSDSSIISYLMPLQIWDSSSISPHNSILAIWADVGAIGLLLYFGVMGSSIVIFIRSFIRNSHTSMKLYYCLLTGIFGGYILSWIKGGGMESDYSFFMMIAFLIIPAILDKNLEREKTKEVLIR